MTTPRTLALLALLILSSCAAIGRRRLTDGDVTQLKPGMTIEQVVELFGLPWKQIHHPLAPSRLTYRYLLRRARVGEEEANPRYDRYGQTVDNRPSQFREIELVFLDGKLVGEG